MKPTITIDPSKSSRPVAGLVGPKTREAWLVRLANALRPLFESHGATIPDRIRFSCSWTRGGRGKAAKARIGECWYPESSADQTTEIFVSPAIDNPLTVASILSHELVHACLGPGHGHGPEFKRLAVAIGLVGKMTATAAGPELAAHLATLCQAIGPYPHAELREGPTADRPKKQGTRMLKVECPSCGYTVRTTAKWLSVGLPTCPCGCEMQAD